MWYFGDHAGIDFNSGAPVALTNGMINQFEGSSTICDGNGNLLFYTDGIIVWDRNHNQMPNGYSLQGGYSSTQSALIVSYPGNSQLYYIFTVQEQSTTYNFNYSIVDMSLNNNNGDVSMKNIFLISPVCEKLTAVKHSNNSDIWVMVHGINNNNFYCYKITSAGILTTPVTSSIGPVIHSAATNYDLIGCMKFSPDGSKIAYAAFSSDYVDLFDFNSTTGFVSSEKYLTLPAGSGGPYGLEFSMSGNYLYSSLVDSHIYQWDITSNSVTIINASIQQIAISSALHLGTLQMGPDRNICCRIWRDAFRCYK